MTYPMLYVLIEEGRLSVIDKGEISDGDFIITLSQEQVENIMDQMYSWLHLEDVTPSEREIANVP